MLNWKQLIKKKKMFVKRDVEEIKPFYKLNGTYPSR